MTIKIAIPLRTFRDYNLFTYVLTSAKLDVMDLPFGAIIFA